MIRSDALLSISFGVILSWYQRLVSPLWQTKLTLSHRCVSEYSSWNPRDRYPLDSFAPSPSASQKQTLLLDCYSILQVVIFVTIGKLGMGRGGPIDRTIRLWWKEKCWRSTAIDVSNGESDVRQYVHAKRRLPDSQMNRQKQGRRESEYRRSTLLFE